MTTHDRMPTEEQTYREGMVERLDRIERKLDFTNGKVKKIIIALVLLGGIAIGQIGASGGILMKVIGGFL